MYPVKFSIYIEPDETDPFRGFMTIMGKIPFVPVAGMFFSWNAPLEDRLDWTVSAKADEINWNVNEGYFDLHLEDDTGLQRVDWEAAGFSVKQRFDDATLATK